MFGALKPWDLGFVGLFWGSFVSEALNRKQITGDDRGQESRSPHGSRQDLGALREDGRGGRMEANRPKSFSKVLRLKCHV